MCTSTRIKHAYQGVQGACPRQAVTSAGGTAERQRAPCRRHRSKACRNEIAMILQRNRDEIAMISQRNRNEIEMK
jgi:hypothetical protein